MNGNNPFYNNQPVMPQYPQFGRGYRGQPPNFNQFIPSTNKSFVRSLEEALSLPADFNSQNVYFDINEDVMYDICTNGRGEKSWSILDISLRQSNGVNTATGMAVSNNPMEDRMKKLEDKMEAILNGQHNAKQADAASE